MKEVSLATLADALDALLDMQMTGQARIAAHLVAAAEAAGHDATKIINTFDDIATETVLDELWITEETGFAYLTNVRTTSGAPMPFSFNADPAVQPQASRFYALLQSPIHSNDVVTQAAQVREIDHEIYKYVGVNGVDRKRIVQVGNALAFEEQGVLDDTYASPVMTAVLAAFGEHDLLASAFTDKLAEIQKVFDSILGNQMIVQATLVDRFIDVAHEAGWSDGEVASRLYRIALHSHIGEIHVATLDGEMLFSEPAEDGEATIICGNELEPLIRGDVRHIDHAVSAIGPRGRLHKCVTVKGKHAARLVQVVAPVSKRSPVSPLFGTTL